MEFTERQLLQFEKAFTHTLSAKEEEVFNKTLLDPEEAKAYSDYVIIRDAIQLEGRRQLKFNLIKNEKQYLDNQAFLKKTIIKIAFLILLVALSIFIYTSTSSGKFNNQKIYAENFQKYPNIIDPLTKSAPKEVSPYQIFEQNNFSEAVAQLQLLQNSDTTHFYIAQSYMALQEFEKAILPLESIINNKEGIFYFDAQWYLALIYINQNKLENAKVLLNNLSHSTSEYYSKKSKLLLSKIK